MSYDNLPGLRITSSDGVATVTLDHPPLNLMDGVLLPSLRGFINRVRSDESTRVIVFESADPEFFSAHGDMAYLTDPDALSATTRAAVAAAQDSPVPDGMNILQAMSEEVHSLPQVTIGKLSGFARGAGNEFLMYLDMRFAAIGRSGQSQTEALMGILPGGGGTVNMTRLAGRARALELILGGELVDAELAERPGEPGSSRRGAGRFRERARGADRAPGAGGRGRDQGGGERGGPSGSARGVRDRERGADGDDGAGRHPACARAAGCGDPDSRGRAGARADHELDLSRVPGAARGRAGPVRPQGQTVASDRSASPCRRRVCHSSIGAEPRAS